MQKLKILNRKELKKLFKIMKEQWNVELKDDSIFMINEKNKLYIANKAVFDIDLSKLRIDSIGLYFGELFKNELRLSIDGSQIIGPLAKKNVVELDEDELKNWFSGLNLDKEPGVENNSFVLIKKNNDFLGCGKFSNKIIYNFVPKARRLGTIC